MDIEFDEEKDAINRVKHGLALARAAELDWANAQVVADERRDYGETRLRVYAVMDGRLHMAAVTIRRNVLRVISLRRANRREARRYGQSPTKD